MTATWTDLPLLRSEIYSVHFRFGTPFVRCGMRYHLTGMFHGDALDLIPVIEHEDDVLPSFDIQLYEIVQMIVDIQNKRCLIVRPEIYKHVLLD